VCRLVSTLIRYDQIMQALECPWLMSSKVKAGKGRFKLGEDTVELISVSIDPHEIGSKKVLEQPEEFLKLMAQAPGESCASSRLPARNCLHVFGVRRMSLHSNARGPGRKPGASL